MPAASDTARFAAPEAACSTEQPATDAPASFSPARQASLSNLRRPSRPVLPFTSIVGQARLKRALLASIIAPAVGGVLIRGEKGTAKSTAVRALASLLPSRAVVADCPCGCAPQGPLCPHCAELAASGCPLPVIERPVRVIELPLGATEDRVVGSLDLERAVRDGVRAFQPGILAAANGNILYVDEVNLLDDHLVDIILDAAASGYNEVQREGIAYSHPSRFTLVGTMNPEEGELRPQLLDRFGLCVEVAGLGTPEERVRLMRLREQWDDAPREVEAAHSDMERLLGQRLEQARLNLRNVRMPESLLRRCAELAQEAFVAGHRADITLHTTARALAALEGRREVLPQDMDEAALLVLPHRRRMPPPPPQEESPHEHEPHDEKQEQENHDRQESQEEHGGNKQEGHATDHDGAAPEEQTADDAESGQDDQSPEQPDESPDDGPATTPPPATPRDRLFAADDPFRVRKLELARDRIARSGSGRRCRTRAASRMGRYVRNQPSSRADDLALDATLRAAAPFQHERGRSGPGLIIRQSDYRRKVRERRVGTCVVLAVDASGSMGANARMSAAKGAVLSLLMDAYQKRDKVALVAFRGNAAEVLLPPTSSVELAYKVLEELPTGGRTPLAHGLELSYGVLDRQLRRDPGAVPVLVLISDCRANAARYGGKPLHEAREVAEGICADERIRSIVIDTEAEGMLSFGLARGVAEHLNAAYYRIEDLKARDIVSALRSELDT